MLGWRDALLAAGIVPVMVQQEHFTEEDGYEALQLLLDAEPELTAVLCFSDTLAHGVMLAAQERGLELPRDLSIVGFDDNPLAARLRPALTTVRQDIAAKGRLAASALVRLVSPADAVTTEAGGHRPDDDAGDPNGEDVRHIVLPTELIIRDSTAPPPR